MGRDKNTAQANTETYTFKIEGDASAVREAIRDGNDELEKPLVVRGSVSPIGDAIVVTDPMHQPSGKPGKLGDKIAVIKYQFEGGENPPASTISVTWSGMKSNPYRIALEKIVKSAMEQFADKSDVIAK